MASINQAGGAPTPGDFAFPVRSSESSSLGTTQEFSRFSRERDNHEKDGVDFNTYLDRSSKGNAPKGASSRQTGQMEEAAAAVEAAPLLFPLPPEHPEPVVVPNERVFQEAPEAEGGVPGLFGSETESNAAEFAGEGVVHRLTAFSWQQPNVPTEESEPLLQDGMRGAMQRLEEAHSVSPSSMPVLNSTIETSAGLSVKEFSFNSGAVPFVAEANVRAAADLASSLGSWNQLQEVPVAEAAEEELPLFDDLEGADAESQQNPVAVQTQPIRDRRQFRDSGAVTNLAARETAAVPVGVHQRGLNPAQTGAAIPATQTAENGEESLASNRQETSLSFDVAPSYRPSSNGAPNLPAFGSVGAGTQAGSAAQGGEAEAAKAPSRAEAVNAIFQQITDAIQRMRTNNRTNVEMQVQLNDGQQLVVRLNFANGEVRATFRTDSAELRQALESNWGQFASQSAEKGIRVAGAEFQGQSSNFAAHDQQRQSPEHRQSGREAAEAQQEFLNFLGQTRESARPQPRTASQQQPEPGQDGKSGWAVYA